MSSPLIRRRLDGGLLGRLLEDPDLAPTLRALPAPALRQVILHVGLEDAGELIALASLEQLRDVFDEDLWTSARPGRDERFDATRFTRWLEVLLEGGERGVADRLAELSEDFLVFAVSQLVRVLDVSVLTEWATDPREAELLDRIFDAPFAQAFDAYLVVARRDSGWDAVLATLLALDEQHPQLLQSVFDHCATATHEEVHSAHVLCDALEGEERLLEDARAEREERRARQGYVSPADARAFLALAQRPVAAPEEDPITRAHFRALEPTTGPAPGRAFGEAAAGSTPLRRLLLDAGAESGIEVETAGGTEASPAVTEAAGSLFRRTLGALFECDPKTHQRVLEELAFLANVLIAGDTRAAEPWQPVEAAEHVFTLCDEGLRAVAPAHGADPAAAREALVRWGAVGVFRVAWAAREGAG